MPKTAETKNNFILFGRRFYSEIVQQLAASGFVKEEKGENRRIIFEKPFGHALKSAQNLDQQIKKHLREDQIFRIDHFVGFPTMLNIKAYRFANGIFDPI